MISITFLSLRIFPLAVEDATSYSDNAQHQSTKIDTVAKFVIGTIFLKVRERGDESSAICECDLEATCRCLSTLLEPHGQVGTV